jgi:hypothetical protein
MLGLMTGLEGRGNGSGIAGMAADGVGRLQLTRSEP